MLRNKLFLVLSLCICSTVGSAFAQDLRTNYNYNRPSPSELSERVMQAAVAALALPVPAPTPSPNAKSVAAPVKPVGVQAIDDKIVALQTELSHDATKAAVINPQIADLQKQEALIQKAFGDAVPQTVQQNFSDAQAALAQAYNEYEAATTAHADESRLTALSGAVELLIKRVKFFEAEADRERAREAGNEELVKHWQAEMAKYDPFEKPQWTINPDVAISPISAEQNGAVPMPAMSYLIKGTLYDDLALHAPLRAGYFGTITLQPQLAGKDSSHIINRLLFNRGDFYFDGGASAYYGVLGLSATFDVAGLAERELVTPATGYHDTVIHLSGRDTTILAQFVHDSTYTTPLEGHLGFNLNASLDLGAVNIMVSRSWRFGGLADDLLARSMKGATSTTLIIGGTFEKTDIQLKMLLQKHLPGDLDKTLNLWETLQLKVGTHI